MKKWLAILLTAIMSFSFAACGTGGTDSSNGGESSQPQEAAESSDSSVASSAGNAEYELRMSCEASEGQWLAEMLQDYADDINEATKGRVHITLYLGNSLGSADDIWTMFQQGSIDMVDMGVAHAGHFPVTDIVQTPFVVDSPQAALAVMQGLEEDGYLTEFTDNMHVVAYMPTLMQELITVDKKVETFDDLSGMVIRSSSTPLSEFVESVGSTSTSIAITDLVMSLSQGVADATITSVDAADVFKLQDVCKYLIDMPISTGMNFIGINNQTWNSLPEDIQAAMDKVGAEYQEKYMELNEQAGIDSVNNMTAGGMIVLEPSDELIQDCKKATSDQLSGLKESLDGEGYDGQAIIDRAVEIANENAGAGKMSESE